MMNKITRSLMVVLVSVLFTGVAMAVPFNITQSDTVASGSDWWSDREDNEVEPWCARSQAWDLEAMLWDAETSSLHLIGGYDFERGYDGVQPGDLFLDTGGDALYGVNVPYDELTGGDQHALVGNVFNYEYVLDINGTSAELVWIGEGANDPVLLEVYYNGNWESNPWSRSEGGDYVTMLDVSYGLYDAGVDAYGLGLAGYYGNNTHYEMTISGLDVLGDSFMGHYTMACGNDLLIGKYGTFNRVPDGGITILLMGISLCVVGMLRKMR